MEITENSHREIREIREREISKRPVSLNSLNSL
jgi:hypothetical protein